jgi:hypothetical protein
LAASATGVRVFQLNAGTFSINWELQLMLNTLMW